MRGRSSNAEPFKRNNMSYQCRTHACNISAVVRVSFILTRFKVVLESSPSEEQILKSNGSILYPCRHELDEGNPESL